MRHKVQEWSHWVVMSSDCHNDEQLRNDNSALKQQHIAVQLYRYVAVVLLLNQGQLEASALSA